MKMLRSLLKAVATVALGIAFIVSGGVPTSAQSVPYYNGAVLVVIAGPLNLTASATSCSTSSSGCVVRSLSGQSTCSVQVSGTFVGTLVVESAVDYITNANTPNWNTPTGWSQTTFTATGSGQGSCANVSAVRARMSAYTSGTAVVTIYGSPGVLGNASGTGGGGGSGAPLPGGTSSPTGTQQSVGVQATDGAGNMVPLQETGSALNVNQTGVGSNNTNPAFVQTVDPSPVHIGTSNFGETTGNPLQVNVVATPGPCPTIASTGTPACGTNVAGVNGVAPPSTGVAGVLPIGGAQAINNAAASNPVLTGGAAHATGSLGSAVSSGNVQQLVTDQYGDLRVLIGSSLPFACSMTLGTSEVQCESILTSSKIWVITSIVAQSTTSTGAAFSLTTTTAASCGGTVDGLFPFTGTTTLPTFTAPPNTAAPMSVPLISGLAVPQNGSICGIGSSATNTVIVNVIGYEII